MSTLYMLPKIEGEALMDEIIGNLGKAVLEYDKVKIMAGGGAITQEFSEKIDDDGLRPQHLKQSS